MKKNRINRAQICKMVDFLKNNYKNQTFVFCAIFIPINLLFTKYILGTVSVKKMILISVIELVVECFAILVLLKLKKNESPLEKQFLFLALVLGVMFIVFLPPGQAPDDVTHFRRAYSLSNGEVLPDLSEDNTVSDFMPMETKYMPILPSEGTYKRLLDNINTSSGEKTDQVYTAAALYNFVCYIPQTIAIMVGKIFGFSILGMAYLAKIFNFLLWLVLVFFAIKLIPKFKYIVAFIALLPISLQEATSISPDSLTIGLSIFLISFVMYLAYGKKRDITKKDLSVLYGMAGLIGLCKIVYLPLIFLYIIIPISKFGSKKRKIIHLLIIFCVTAIINFTWLMLSSKYLVEYNEGVNSGVQLKNIIQNPIGYFEVLFNTVNMYIQPWLNNMLGLKLGAFVFSLPDAFFLISFSVMILLFVQRSETLRIRSMDRVIFSCVFLMIFCLILTSLYMQWTPVGYDTVEGVQGRYFLPILLLVPVMITRFNNKKPYNNLVTQNVVLLYSLFVNVIALLTIFAQNI